MNSEKNHFEPNVPITIGILLIGFVTLFAIYNLKKQEVTQQQEPEVIAKKGPSEEIIRQRALELGEVIPFSEWFALARTEKPKKPQIYRFLACVDGRTTPAVSEKFIESSRGNFCNAEKLVLMDPGALKKHVHRELVNTFGEMKCVTGLLYKDKVIFAGLAPENECY